MKIYIICFIFFAGVFSQVKPDYSKTEKLLKKYIYKGYVAYGKWHRAKNDLALLKSEVEYLSQFSKKNLSSEDDKALLINLYNLAVISLVLEHYPVSSIMKIDDAFKRSFIKYKEKTYSLDELEKRVLIKKYPDARLHFALVCAALSCPYLQNYAYKGDKLDKTLDLVSSEFINNKKLNTFGSEVKISKIFDWYKADFGGEKKLYMFLNKYLKSGKLTANTKISYQEYNWKLNGETSLISNFGK